MTHYTKGTLSHRKGAPTDCRRSVSGTVSLPSSGCFSPFPHGTGSLSVSREYLALEGGPPSFEQDFTCPVLLRCHRAAHGFRLRGSNPLWRTFPSASANPLPARVMVLQPHPAHRVVWALPRSLAATEGISFDFFSSGYLDVSVPRVRFADL